MHVLTVSGLLVLLGLAMLSWATRLPQALPPDQVAVISK
jgi:hypothetical protein